MAMKLYQFSVSLVLHSCKGHTPADAHLYKTSIYIYSPVSNPSLYNKITALQNFYCHTF